MSQRAEVSPIGVQVDHSGGNASHCGFLSDDPGEVAQVLLGFSDDLRIVVVLDFLVPGNYEGGLERRYRGPSVSTMNCPEERDLDVCQALRGWATMGPTADRRVRQGPRVIGLAAVTFGGTRLWGSGQLG